MKLRRDEELVKNGILSYAETVMSMDQLLNILGMTPEVLKYLMHHFMITGIVKDSIRRNHLEIKYPMKPIGEILRTAKRCKSFKELAVAVGTTQYRLCRHLEDIFESSSDVIVLKSIDKIFRRLGHPGEDQ